MNFSTMISVRYLLLVMMTATTCCTSFHSEQTVTGSNNCRCRLETRRPSTSSIGLYQATGADHDPVLRLPLMEAELATLQEGDHDDDDADEQKQVELQEAISNAKTAAEFGVRKAQSEFYDAFSRGDIEAMEKVWSSKSTVRCVHPGMNSLEGRDKVMSSWKQIFQSGGDDSGQSFNIAPSRTVVEIHGLMALCSCVEKTDGGGSLEALNIYKREEGSWKMTLHMASPTVVSIQSGGAFF